MSGYLTMASRFNTTILFKQSRVTQIGKSEKWSFYNFLLKEYADLKKLTLSTEDALAIMQNKVEQLYDMDIFAQEPLALEAIDETLQPKIQEAIVFWTINPRKIDRGFPEYFNCPPLFCCFILHKWMKRFIQIPKISILAK